MHRSSGKVTGNYHERGIRSVAKRVSPKTLDVVMIPRDGSHILKS